MGTVPVVTVTKLLILQIEYFVLFIEYGDTGITFTPK